MKDNVIYYKNVIKMIKGNSYFKYIIDKNNITAYIEILLQKSHIPTVMKIYRKVKRLSSIENNTYDIIPNCYISKNSCIIFVSVDFKKEYLTFKEIDKIFDKMKKVKKYVYNR